MIIAPAVQMSVMYNLKGFVNMEMDQESLLLENNIQPRQSLDHPSPCTPPLPAL
jgi:hypothetical protein